MLLSSLTVHPLKAQIYWTNSIGTNQYFGDIGGSFSPSDPNLSELNLKSIRYHLSTGLRVHLSNSLSYRVGAYYARLSANDKYTSDVPRHNRNLNFFTPVIGLSAMLEWHFGIGTRPKKRFSLFGGMDGFYFNPRTKYHGKSVSLQPLGTEGQFFMPGMKPYSRISYAWTGGMGFKFLYFKNGYLSFEMIGKKTATDYLDDASTNYPDKTKLLASNGQIAVDLSDPSLGQIPGFSDPGQKRASPKYKDNFLFFAVTLNYTLREKNKYPGRRQRYYGLGGSSSRCYAY